MASTVGFGRRIGTGDELDQSTWDAFREDVATAVTVAGGDVIFTGTGDGIWQGVAEPAACVVFVGGDTDQIAAALRILASTYGQDSIALTIGETVFCEPVKVGR